MRSISRLSSIALPVIAIAAAKVIKSFYPYIKLHIEESVYEDASGKYPAYTVISANGTHWVDAYRDNNLEHWVVPSECDTFVERDDTTGDVWSIESEFYDKLWEELKNN